MSVLIAHARRDERGRYSGGVAGDQDGGEVAITAWYSRPWNYVIRFKKAKKANKVAQLMRDAAANNHIGYDQGQRNTLLSKSRSQSPKYSVANITENCETDCSALVSLACMYAGISENILTYGGNSCTTATLRNALLSTGEVEVFTSSSYTATSANLLVGDILLYEGHHVAAVVNVNGSTSRGTSTTTANTNGYDLKTFVKEIQKAIGVTVDGVAGKETLKNTVTVSKDINNKHAVVKPLQKRLNALGYNVGTADGEAGPKFDSGAKKFQKEKVGLSKPDGEFTKGQGSWKKILGMS